MKGHNHMNNNGIRVAFVSLGCPKNLIDTEVMLSLLNEKGFEIVADDIDADVVVINTCAFIESAKKESIDNILDVAWLKENKNLKGIVVTGCLAERYRDEVFKELPEVDAIIGTGSIEHIAEAVIKAYEGKEKYSSFHSPSEAPFFSERVVTTPEHFAYLKIAEGCDNRCTYCVIPDIRGKFRSRPILEIIEEAKDLASMGVKEICLVAQDTTKYGEDIFGMYALDALITEISEIEGIEWIRLLYCYPERITDSLIEVIATNDKVVKYIDMPIQHISDHVLTRMNRKGTEETIRNAIKRLRERIPDIVLRTTVITGFPGETEDDFKKLKEFVKEGNFERLGAFSYSREEGTPAYDFENQVPEKTKDKRRDIIMREQQKIHINFNESLIGKTLLVVCEGYDKVSETYFGRSFMDAPDIDGKIFFSSPFRVEDGDFVKVQLTEIFDYDLIGKVVGRKD